MDEREIFKRLVRADMLREILSELVRDESEISVECLQLVNAVIELMERNTPSARQAVIDAIEGVTKKHPIQP